MYVEGKTEGERECMTKEKRHLDIYPESTFEKSNITKD